MNMSNGHVLSGAQRTLFELAIRKGINPTFTSIAKAAQVHPATVVNAFGAPGCGSHSPHSGSLTKIASALGVPIEELRRIHASLQLEEPPPPPVKLLPPVKAKPAPEPKAPRDLWAELTEAALSGATVIVVAYSEVQGQSIARGIVTGMHEDLVAVQTVGDGRPVRIRREFVKDVRRPEKSSKP